MTERTRMTFTVKAYADGTPWIALEPLVENLSVLGKGILGFDLAPGTTHDEAERIAQSMNDQLAATTYTIIPGWSAS